MKATLCFILVLTLCFTGQVKTIAQTEWVKYSGNPVLDIGTNGTWEEWGVTNPTVLFDGAKYQMWYSGYDGSNRRIGYATSIPDTNLPEEAITTLIGHTDEVDSLAFSPDVTLLVSGGNWDSNGIRLWDVKTWKMIRTFPSSQPIMDITFSPDGKNIASASYDHTVKLWDVITGNMIWTYTHTNQVHGVDFSPDGRFVAVAPTSGLLDASNGNEVKRLSIPERSITSVDFHPDGRLLSTTWGNKDIVVWDIITEEPIKTFSPETSRMTAFSPDGRFLAFGLNGEVKLWEIETDEVRTLGGQSVSIATLDSAPMGELLQPLFLKTPFFSGMWRLEIVLRYL